MKPLSSPKKHSWLGWFFRGILLLGILVLLGRLVELQIIKGNYYKNLANENRIRRIPILASRGKILAHGGEVLVGNKEVERRVVFKPEEGYEKLDNVTDAKPDELIKEPIRYYYLGEKFAHISGYLGRVNEDEVGKVNPNCTEKGPLSSENFVGRGGLEEQYECILSGIDGEELVEVDTAGNKVRTLGRREPVPGRDIVTNIDIFLQKKVVELMEGKKGSAVVTDIEGRILALHSSPSYDPNIFIEGEDGDIEDILTDSDLPLFNRVISGTYPPGSVFKPVVAIAALSEGVIEPDYIYEDPGIIEVNEFSYTNWYYNMYGATEGAINIEKAIARSTDTFFYKTGEFLGIEKLADWAKKFGYGEVSLVDLPNEASGLIPTSDWKQRTKGERWFLGNTYHVAIGQGDVLTTPLQVNFVTTTIASRGKLCPPKVVDNVATGIKEDDKCKNLDVDQDALKTTINGMVAACAEGGTGYSFFSFSPTSITEEKKVACKTGTAETFEDGDPHAWFVVFAPVEKPEIITTIMLEYAGEGAIEAAPIARDIFDYWFGEPAE